MRRAGARAPWPRAIALTLYTLVLDALRLDKLSEGPPYFEAVFMPLMAPALFLMGVAPLARWFSTHGALPVSGSAERST